MFNVKRYIYLCAFLVMMFTLPLVAWAGQAKSYTAEYFLREIPTTIFDNTEWPISEKEKNFLINPGYCSKWLVSKKTDEFIQISSMSIEKTEVFIRVYHRDNGSGLVVFAVDGSLGCTTEIWEFNPRGGIVPYYDMPEPGINDYFEKSFFVPRSLSYSTTLCLQDKYLHAIPSFWTMSGLVDMPLDKEIFYYWNGNEFVKIITNPVEDLCRIDGDKGHLNNCSVWDSSFSIKSLDGMSDEEILEVEGEIFPKSEESSDVAKNALNHQNIFIENTKNKEDSINIEDSTFEKIPNIESKISGENAAKELTLEKAPDKVADEVGGIKKDPRLE